MENFNQLMDLPYLDDQFIIENWINPLSPLKPQNAFGTLNPDLEMCKSLMNHYLRKMKVFYDFNQSFSFKMDTLEKIQNSLIVLESTLLYKLHQQHSRVSKGGFATLPLMEESFLKSDLPTKSRRANVPNYPSDRNLEILFKLLKNN